MKAIKIFAVFAILLASFSVRAVCPVQETTVMFINGIWTTWDEAFQHKKALEKEVYAANVSPECVHFTLSHTQDDSLITDIAESLVQKSQELNSPLSLFTDMLFRVIPPDNIFLSTIADVYLRHVNLVIDTELDKQVQNLRDFALNKGQRGIVVTHSQGGFYGNAILGRLTSTEQTNARLVTVATPAENVAGGGPNTRLTRDGVANLFFANALAAGTIPNTGLCDQEVTEEANSWLCHGFETGYLHDVGARAQIIGDIKAALPILPTIPPPTIPTQFYGTIVNDHYLQLKGFVPNSDSWILTRSDYDTADFTAWSKGSCVTLSGTTIGNLDWLTFDYVFITNGNITGNFSTTGVNLNISQGGVNGNGVSCQASGTWYLAVYESHGKFSLRVFKGVVVLNQIDATHWTTVSAP